MPSAVAVRIFGRASVRALTLTGRLAAASLFVGVNAALSLKARVLERTETFLRGEGEDRDKSSSECHDTRQKK